VSHRCGSQCESSHLELARHIYPLCLFTLVRDNHAVLESQEQTHKVRSYRQQDIARRQMVKYMERTTGRAQRAMREAG
jgi:hypothetical protein